MCGAACGILLVYQEYTTAHRACQVSVQAGICRFCDRWETFWVFCAPRPRHHQQPGTNALLSPTTPLFALRFV